MGEARAKPSIKSADTPPDHSHFQMHKMIELLSVALAFIGTVEGQVITGTEISTINCEGEDLSLIHI